MKQVPRGFDKKPADIRAEMNKLKTKPILKNNSKPIELRKAMVNIKRGLK